jgi:hypothetical protein
MVKVWKLEEVSKNKVENDKVIPLTDEERNALLIEWNNYESKAPDRKLEKIREIRNQKLKETDFYSLGDVAMPDNIKTWRQSLRDIPANHTDEDAYDLLLAVNDAGKLTHSIWEKP